MPDATHTDSTRTITRDPVHRVRYAFEPDGENLYVENWLEPGAVLPAHLHPRQEERWTVLEGEVRFQLGRERRVITPADGTIVVRPNVMHALWSTGAEAHLRCHVLPALGLQAFLQESSQAAQDGLFKKGGIPTGLRGARWAAEFLKRNREDVVMAFPPAFAQSAMIKLFAR